ncbi:MAG: hypothetical protein ACXW4J_07920 [Candidatus Deferrimicrobiaceae bacterium]
MSNNNAKINRSGIGLNLHIFSLSSRFPFCFLENFRPNRRNKFPTEVYISAGLWALTTEKSWLFLLSDATALGGQAEGCFRQKVL